MLQEVAYENIVIKMKLPLCPPLIFIIPYYTWLVGFFEWCVEFCCYTVLLFSIDHKVNTSTVLLFCTVQW